MRWFVVAVFACAVGCDSFGPADAPYREAPILPRPTRVDSSTRACPKYPVPFEAVSDEHKARAALQAISPNAQLEWSTARGAPARIDNLDLVLECAQQQNLLQEILDFVGSTPDLFGINASEWMVGTDLPCGVVGRDPLPLALVRERIGGMPTTDNVLMLIVQRDGDNITLHTVISSYLGRTSHYTKGLLRACHSLAPVEQVARSHSFPFETHQRCVPTGRGSYLPRPNDTVDATASPTWRWSSSDGVHTRLRAVRRVELHVAPENVTDTLKDSTAACPRDDGSLAVGFRVDIDDVTGEILSVQPGIGCVVCAH